MTADDTFALFWKRAPARAGFKVGKRAARRKFDRLDEADWPLLLQAVEKYRRYIETTQGLAKDPERFIGNREDSEYWREWVPDQPSASAEVRQVVKQVADVLSMGRKG